MVGAPGIARGRVEVHGPEFMMLLALVCSALYARVQSTWAHTAKEDELIVAVLRFFGSSSAMSLPFNYRHLHYFWVVVKEGGIAKAAERLGMAVQTVSAQVRDLEHELGFALLKTSGRRVELTDAGRE